MDSSSDTPADGRSTRNRELQGPLPSSPLRIHKESHKIKKKHPPAPQPQAQPRKPVIIYEVTPKIIHVSPRNFKTHVQRLTGLPSSSSSSSSLSSSSSASNVDQSCSEPFNGNGTGAISSTAVPLDQWKKQQAGDGMSGILEVDRGVEMMDSFPGILSPVPTTLPPIPPSFFSRPQSDPTQSSNFFPDLSPVLDHGGRNNRMEEGISFMPSSTNLVSVAPITYPSLNSSINYLFNNSLGMESSTIMPRPSSFVSTPMTSPNNITCYSFNNSFGMESSFMPRPSNFVSPPMAYPSTTTPSIDQYNISFNNSFGMEGSFMQPSPPNFVSPPIVLTYPSTTPSVSSPILTNPTTPPMDDGGDDVVEYLLNSFLVD